LASPVLVTKIHAANIKQTENVDNLRLRDILNVRFGASGIGCGVSIMLALSPPKYE
jgi:hypothetical protein